MSWIQLRLGAGNADPESVSDALMELGAVSVTLQDAADQPIFEPDPGDTPLWDSTQVVALFEPDTDLAGLRSAIAGRLGADALTRLQVETLEDRDWERAWMEDFRPMQFGDRLWVRPTGMEVTADDAVILDLDPGLAFGTGTHPTTALCLEWLDRHPPGGLNVIDFGCGSGILAIAALKLGAREVWGTDIDDQALWASRDNAARNGVADRLQLALPDDFNVAPADLVLANILANPLLTLAEQLAARVRPGGEIVLSGVLAEQAEEVQERYRAWFDMSPVVEQEGWVRLHGTRKP